MDLDTLQICTLCYSSHKEQWTMKRILPPVAEKRPHTTITHGHTLEDPYFWMRDVEDPSTMPYIDAEQAYTDAVMEPQAELRQQLFEELKSRIVEVDQSVPYRYGEFVYYSRTIAGGEYRIHCRKAITPDAKEEILIDGNEEAKGRSFFSIGDLAPSPSGRYLAYSIDEDGDEYYTIFVKDLHTGKLSGPLVSQTSGTVEWSEDEGFLFYVRCNEHHQPLFVYRHALGSSSTEDLLLYEEKDTAFYADVCKSASHDYLFIELSGPNQTEIWFIASDGTDSVPKCLVTRSPGDEYEVDHSHGYFYVSTNADGATDSKLLRCAESAWEQGEWSEVLPHQLGRLLVDFGLYGDFLVIQQRENVHDTLYVHRYDTLGQDEPIQIELPYSDEPYDISFGSAEDAPSSNILRLTYESMKRPQEVYDINLLTQQRELKKRKEIPGSFSPDDYRSERIYATVRDGVRVPMTLLYHKDTPLDGTAPVLQYGYGAYGHPCLPSFAAKRLSLVDRGWIWAIAHIRGGRELGYQWYLDGKMEKKTNTFNDFVDCAKHLIESGYTSKGCIAACGRSAGGLLMGAVLNQAPELFGAALAGVPFVDIVHTMLDTTLPLTTGEFNEWGNPAADPETYHRLLAYSPYDNVADRPYPHILITAGLHDYRVTYWEPLKWLAKLRLFQRDEQLLLLHMNRAAGHFGKSGRYDYLHEPALELAFLLRALETKNAM